MDYPHAGMKPVSVDHNSAACFQDFVDVFCREMWVRPNIEAIKNALTVAFKNDQIRYGKNIVPDRKSRIAGFNG